MDSKRISLDTSATFTGDYSTQTGWTQVGSTISITGGYAYANNSGSALGAYIHTPLGSTLSDTKWIAEFEYYNVGAVNLFPFILASGTSTVWNSTQDMIGVGEESPNMLKIIYKDGSGSVQQSPSTGFSSTMSTGTTYYCTVIRDGSSLSLKLYIDSARTVQLGSDATLTISGTVSGLTTLHHSGRDDGGATSGYYFKVKGTKIYDGVTSTPSKPTNVQDNSILVEKDTANRYWGSNSTVKVSDIEDKTLVANGSGIGYSGAYIDVNIPNFASYTGDYRLRTLDTTITTTDFVLDFDWWRQGANSPPNTSAGLVLRSSQSGLSIENSGITSDDYIRTNANDAGTTLEFLWHSAGTSTETSIGTIAVGSIQAWKYMRLTRTDATTLKFEQFSSESRTGSATLTVNYTSLPSSWGLGLKYIGGYCSDANAGGGLHERLQNIDLSSTSNGTLTTWTMEPTYETDFSSSTGWTQVGSTVSIGSGIASLLPTSGNNDRVYRSISFNTNGKFVMDYDVIINSENKSDSSSIVTTMLSNNSTGDLSDDTLMWGFAFHTSSPTINLFGKNYAGGSEDSTAEGTVEFNTGDQYFARITRDGTTTTNSLASSSANRDAGVWLDSVTITMGAGVTNDMTRLVLGGRVSGTNSADIDVDNLSLYNGVTTKN
tara:strand:+ start:27 stop:2003 length:1977 start_codon:yes stop_codon:yes gene_type:complete